MTVSGQDHFHKAVVPVVESWNKAMSPLNNSLLEIRAECER